MPRSDRYRLMAWHPDPGYRAASRADVSTRAVTPNVHSADHQADQKPVAARKGRTRIYFSESKPPRATRNSPSPDRKTVETGKSGSRRVDLGGRLYIKQHT